MRKAQVFLREEQQAALREIARRTGAKQSELIRRGVDLMIVEEKRRCSDWHAAVAAVAGMWRDRSDLDETMAGVRRQLVDRAARHGGSGA